MDPEELIESLLLGENLKSLPRIGWLLAGMGHDASESIASHSWGVSYIALVLADTLIKEGVHINTQDVLIMAVIHDLPEAVLSDIPRRDGGAWDDLQVAKHSVEREVMDRLTRAGLDSDMIRRSWKALSEGAATEARVVHAADVLDMLLHGIVLLRRGTNPALLRQFFESGVSRLTELEIRPAIELGEYLFKMYESFTFRGSGAQGEIPTNRSGKDTRNP
ncbi:MAG: HD domain-containing protein [Candidatus Thorarchaeota archaeon]